MVKRMNMTKATPNLEQKVPSLTWILTDVDQQIHENGFHAASEDAAAGTGAWQVTQRTLQGGLSQGVDIIEVYNGRMRLLILPTRGMGVWRAEASDGQTLGWDSPVRGPVHPSYVPIHDPSGLGWLEGFDELLVRCGLESNGAPEFDEQGKLIYPLHGRIANRPAYRVELTVDEQDRTISVRGYVEETRFHFQKLRLEAEVSTSFDSTSFTISDRVENFGGTESQMQMLYHLNVGEPLLGPGAEFVAPVREVAPRDPGTPKTDDWRRFGLAVAGAAEQCYYMRLQGDETGQTRVLLKSADGATGVAVGVNTEQLGCFALWKNMVSRADGYVAGLEPATNFPNCRSPEADAGRVLSLAPGETWSAEVKVDWLTRKEEVERAQAGIASLSQERTS